MLPEQTCCGSLSLQQDGRLLCEQILSNRKRYEEDQDELQASSLGFVSSPLAVLRPLVASCPKRRSLGNRIGYIPMVKASHGARKEFSFRSVSFVMRLFPLPVRNLLSHWDWLVKGRRNG